ncbi:MAG: hypothetical protein COC15_01205 [Legionellales bacterium]|nr:MAG: hypothetical protein COC15_01205 [Legionellales bacterium]
MKKIIICADDYALSPGVSRGIRELLELRRISATSVMTLGAAWPTEARSLQAFANQADIGLHFTLTDLKPLTAMPKFAPNNKLPSLGKIIRMAYSRTLPLDEIAAELLRQFTTFIEYFGTLPTHLDGHQHIQLLPGIREIIIKLYQRHCNNSAIYIRNCGLNYRQILQQTAIIKPSVLNLMGLVLKKQLLQHNIPTNHDFTGVYDFFASKINYPHIFTKFLDITQENTMIMCHPGYVDSELEQLDPVTQQRAVELKFFKSTQFHNMLAEKNITLYTDQI